jgi:hypothetical protein
MIPLSECCGEEMPNWPDSDICPCCLKHTGIEEDEDDGEDEDIPCENDELDYPEEPQGIQEAYDAD